MDAGQELNDDQKVRFFCGANLNANRSTKRSGKRGERKLFRCPVQVCGSSVDSSADVIHHILKQHKFNVCLIVKILDRLLQTLKPLKLKLIHSEFPVL